MSDDDGRAKGTDSRSGAALFISRDATDIMIEIVDRFDHVLAYSLQAPANARAIAGVLCELAAEIEAADLTAKPQ